VFISVLIDTFFDCLRMLPFLLVAYFLIEYLERTQSERLEAALGKGGKFGFIPGALLGLIPQCGFSGMAANLYAGSVITLGTLTAVFISTSDEALPLLIANPEGWRSLGVLMLLKLIYALLVGFFLDIVLRKIIPAPIRGGFNGSSAEIDCHDHDESESLITATLRHTGIILAWIFVILLLINLGVELIGEDNLERFIAASGRWSILVCALIGLIPNCASSVLLTQMYASGALSFAAMFAGLCSGSGIGTLVLLKAEKNKSRAVILLALMYILGVAGGLIVSLLQ